MWPGRVVLCLQWLCSQVGICSAHRARHAALLPCPASLHEQSCCPASGRSPDQPFAWRGSEHLSGPCLLPMQNPLSDAGSVACRLHVPTAGHMRIVDG